MNTGMSVKRRTKKGAGPGSGGEDLVGGKDAVGGKEGEWVRTGGRAPCLARRYRRSLPHFPEHSNSRGKPCLGVSLVVEQA